jgi:4-amino-4-deoxy-L-arabinose transferase-like glycosyltransferase
MSETSSACSTRSSESVLDSAPVKPAVPRPTIDERSCAAMATRPRRSRRLAVHHVLLAGILALSAVLNTWRLSQNGYANVFYSASVRSMLDSLHNFLFASFDPGGLVTVDKPPLGIWTQVASAKLFGFHPLSLLLPEAIIGVLSVLVLYRVLSRRLGPGAGLAGALALAVFPSFVAVSRENGVDPLLILLMLLACGAMLAAIETGKLRSLLASAVLVGLAFNTKTLAAALVVPGLGLGYLLCAPGALRARLVRLLGAAAVMGAVSFAWIAFVELTPASRRPYVGSSQHNSELGLTFKYNGLGRVGGEQGGPGRLAHRAVPLHASTPAQAPARPAVSAPKQAVAVTYSSGREVSPIPFGGPVGPLRLFDSELGDQGAWLLPFAFVGLLALALGIWRNGLRRRDSQLSTLIVFGAWFLTEAVVLSFSKGIVHPYYVSALAPGTAAMIGAGAAVLFAGRDLRPRLGLALVACAALSTVAIEAILLDRERYMQWLIPLLAVLVAVCLAALMGTGGAWRARTRPRLARAAMGLLVCALAIAPAAYSATTWLAPVEGTLPSAGPRHTAGQGQFGLSPATMSVDEQLMAYVRAHAPARRWALLTEASITAAPYILSGMNAGAIAGYSATDPVLDGTGLARLVALGQARYVLLGGAYSLRGGNLATAAVARACRAIPAARWLASGRSYDGLVLFDCRGREALLRSASS